MPSAPTPPGIAGARAKNWILLSAIVTMGLGFLNSYLVKRRNPRVRLFIGTGVLYIVLSAWAEFDATTAGYMAVLVMITAILLEGGGVLNFLVGRGTSDNLSHTTTGTPTPQTPQKVKNLLSVPLIPSPLPFIKGGPHVDINQKGKPSLHVSIPSIHIPTPLDPLKDFPGVP